MGGTTGSIVEAKVSGRSARIGEHVWEGAKGAVIGAALGALDGPSSRSTAAGAAAGLKANLVEGLLPTSTASRITSEISTGWLDIPGISSPGRERSSVSEIIAGAFCGFLSGLAVVLVYAVLSARGRLVAGAAAALVLACAVGLVPYIEDQLRVLKSPTAPLLWTAWAVGLTGGILLLLSGPMVGGDEPATSRQFSVGHGLFLGVFGIVVPSLILAESWHRLPERAEPLGVFVMFQLTFGVLLAALALGHFLWLIVATRLFPPEYVHRGIDHERIWPAVSHRLVDFFGDLNRD